MPLSIKNPRAEALAAEVAKETGETLTEAVIVALQERLERLRGRRSTLDLVGRLTEMAERCQKLPGLDTRSPDEILGYDRTGTFEGDSSSVTTSPGRT